MPASYEEIRAYFIESVEELTYAELAAKFDVPLSSLQKRASRERWQDRRSEHQELSATYATKVKRLKARALDELLEGDGKIDPQKVHAWRSLEAAFPEHRYTAALNEGRRHQICAVLVEELVDHLGEHAPSTLDEIEAHLDSLVERWLRADWDRR